MVDDDMERFSRAFAAVQLAYPSREPRRDKERSNLYWRVLRPHPIEAVERAFERALTDPGRQFPPTTGELVGFIVGNARERALRAWLRVRAAMEYPGVYESVDFGHPLNAVVAAMGGWVAVCNWRQLPEREWGFRERDFLEAHEVVEHGPSREVKWLAGIIEGQNRLTAGQWGPEQQYQAQIHRIGPAGEVVGAVPLPAARPLPELAEVAGADDAPAEGAPAAVRDLIASWRERAKKELVDEAKRERPWRVGR